MGMVTAAPLFPLVLITIISLIIVSNSSLQIGAARNVIKYLPAFAGPLPFHLETGYVEVDEENGVELFYYFIESESSPETDPLILWITGGPGCSAFSGLVFEIGPMKFDVANYTEGFPTLEYFSDSWTQASSIIFLDAPVGTGFSYAKEEQGYTTTLTQSARRLVTFLRKWLAERPEFKSNALYVGGDSYSGYTVPVTALAIAHANQAGDGLHLNLKGYLVGNGATDTFYDGNARVPFLHGTGLISHEMYELARTTCQEDYVTPRNAQCSLALQSINFCVIGVNPVHILEPICGFAVRKPDVLKADSRRRLVEDNLDLLQISNLKLPVECRDNGYRLSYIWADDPDVREVLGIHKGSIGSWSRCTGLSHFTHDVESAIPYHFNLTTLGFRALVYNGDHDLNIPHIGSQAWIRSLNFSIVDDWRAWYSGGQVAGFTRSYSNNLTFATVKGGGHTAPEYKPKECLAMLQRWLSGVPL